MDAGTLSTGGCSPTPEGESLHPAPARSGRRWKALAGLLGLVLLAAGGLAWVERHSLQAWYCVRGLTRAGEAEREAWVARAVPLGEKVVPPLVEHLIGADEKVAANIDAALLALGRNWGPADPHTADLLQRLAQAFGRCGHPGQEAALRVAAGCLPPRAELHPGLLPACARLLEEADETQNSRVLGAALTLAEAVLEHPHGREVVAPARDVVRAGLRSCEDDNRLHAVRLTAHSGVDLLPLVVALLQDPAAPVRRATLLVVGAQDQVVHDESLLPSLHDPDPEVRRLCEDVLRDRGLRPEHLQLGRLLTDPRPVQRLRVLDHLPSVPDIDPGLWLRRLSHDSSPAVRVAALRAMSQQSLVDLTDRLEQMARTDPSPSVCQLARFYLERQRPTGVLHPASER